MFVQLLTEGETPTTPTTKAHLDRWIEVYGLPFSAAKEMDGKNFSLRQTLGPRETAYILERSTMKIVKTGSSDSLLGEIKSLP